MTKLNKAARAILAGIYVSIGCIGYIRSDSPVIGAFMFSIGLLVICMFHLYLFTCQVHRVVYSQPNALKRIIRNLVLMWFGNFAGCWFSVLLIRLTRYRGAMEEICREIVRNKIQDGPSGLFVLGVGCNILIYTAVHAYKNEDSVIGALAVVLSVMAFVSCGFEHSIADAFILIMANAGFMERIHVLLPVALGNSVGGIIPALVLER